MRPFVSVVIPCRNEAAALAQCLDSVLRSDYPEERLEILVSDGASEDGTRDLLSRYSAGDRHIRVISNPARISPCGLNRAISEAQGDYILRVDAHSLISPRYISQLVGFLENQPDAWGAGGSMKTVAVESGPFAEAIRTVLSHRFGVGNSHFRTLLASGEHSDAVRVDTVFNCCWRREVFQKIGLFHEQLVRSQDIEFSSRISKAGGTLWLLPDAHTTYLAKSRLWPYIRHNFSNGIWSILPAAYLGRLPVRLRHLVPLAFVGSLLIAILGGIGFPAFRWLAAVIAGSYLLANLSISFIEAWSRRSLKFCATLPLAFSGLHLGYGAGSLWGCCRLLKEVSGTPSLPPSLTQKPQAKAASAANGAPDHASEPRLLFPE